MPKLILFASPFHSDRKIIDVEVGTTVREAVHQVLPGMAESALVILNDHKVGLVDLRLVESDALIVRAVPTGGAEKGWGQAGALINRWTDNPWNWINPGMYLAAGLTFLGTTLFGTQQSAGSGRSGSNGNLGIHGGQNQAKPYGQVPIILGKSIISPPLGSKVYTDWDGSSPQKQTLTQIFIVGLGRYEVSAIKIGDRLVSSFNPAPTPAIQTMTNDVYGRIVTESGVGIELKHSNGPLIQTSTPDIDWMSLDISFPAGLTAYDIDNKRKNSRNVGFTVEYKKTTTGSWAGAALVSLSYSENHTRSVTKKFDIDAAMLTAAGQHPIGDVSRYKGTWDVKVTRTTGDSNDAKYVDKSHWTVLRSIQNKEPISAAAKGVTTRVALTIQATDQLNGAIDNFNLEAQSVVPCWDAGGSGASHWTGATALGYPAVWKNVDMTTGGFTWNTWNGDATSNPAALYLWLLRGPANPKPIPDSLIDWAAFEAWYTFCAAGGLEVNAVWDQGGQLIDLLDKVAFVGRAASFMRDSKYSIVVDAPHASPVQHFTPRNSRSFSASKKFVTPVHAIRAQFVDKDSAWKQAEQVVYMAGYDANTATEFRTQQIWGVTNYQQAYKSIFYQVAVETLRPEIYQMEVDFEHLACQRGDMVVISHDVLLYGLQAARVSSVTLDGSLRATSVTLDEDVTMETGKSYGLRWRRMDGTSVVAPVNLAVGTTRTLNFTTPVVAGSVPEVDDLCSFGISGSEAQPMLVVSIEMLDEFSARVTLNNYDPAVYTADTGVIPAWSSGMTLPAPVGYGTVPPLSVPTTQEEPPLSVAPIFLGAFATNPTTANIGDWYYNTTYHVVRVFTDAGWIDDSDPGRFAIAAPTILDVEAADAGGNTPTITYIENLVATNAFFDAVQARDMDVTGTITANAGRIAGFTISGSDLVAGSGVTRVGMSAGGATPAFWAGDDTPTAAPFQVSKAGALKSVSGLIAGWTIAASLLTGGLTSLAADGRIWAGDASFGSAPFSVAADGSVKATAGTIGGISLTSSSIYGTDFSLTSGGDLSMGTGSDLVRLSATDATYRLWVGNATAASAPFRVSKTGALVATQATITGDLTANTLTANTSGTIAGWLITSTALQSGASGAARIVLDKSLMRVTVESSSGPVSVMGYLSGLLKNGSPWSSTKTYAIGDYVNLSGITYKATAASTGQSPPNASYWAVSTDTWTSSDYGFWAKQGQYLRIDGDVQVANGDWIIARDASYLIKQGSTVVTRLGMKDGNNGLYINETNSGSSFRSWMTSSGFFVGNDSAYLSFSGGSLSLLLTSFKVATSLTSVLGSLEISTTGTISALTNQLTLSATAASGTINHPTYLSLYAGSTGTVSISGASSADVGLSIFTGALSGDYSRIRFYENLANYSNIHVFSGAWNGGSGGADLYTKSSGAINIDGRYGVTFGLWSSPDMIVSRAGATYIRGPVLVGWSDASGPVAGPNYLSLGNSYSNGATRDKLKIRLYDGAGTEKYGFSVGSSADIQYHSSTSHDFYFSNTLYVSFSTSLLHLALKTRVSGGFTVRPGAEANYSEGIRIANANDNYSILCLGASTSADVGWSAGMWLLQKDPSNNFTIIGPNTANSSPAGYLGIFKGGNLQLNTDVGSYTPLNIGSASFSWAGSSTYPTIYGNSADRWFMMTFPHIAFLRNGVRGHTGGTFGATVRFEMGTGAGAAGNYWDIGVGANGQAEDGFSIGRMGTAHFSIDNAGHAYVTGSIYSINGYVFAENIGTRFEAASAGTVSSAYTFPGLNHVNDTFAIYGTKSGTHFVTIPANHIGTGFYTNGSGNSVAMEGAGPLSFFASNGPFYCIYTRIA